MKSFSFSLGIFIGAEPLNLSQGSFSHFPQCSNFLLFTQQLYIPHIFSPVYSNQNTSPPIVGQPLQSIE